MTVTVPGLPWGSTVGDAQDNVGAGASSFTAWTPYEFVAFVNSYDLLEIVDDRYEKGSLLVTSQVPVNRWHELVGEPSIS